MPARARKPKLPRPSVYVATPTKVSRISYVPTIRVTDLVDAKFLKLSEDDKFEDYLPCIVSSFYTGYREAVRWTDTWDPEVTPQRLFQEMLHSFLKDGTLAKKKIAGDILASRRRAVQKAIFDSDGGKPLLECMASFYKVRLVLHAAGREEVFNTGCKTSLTLFFDGERWLYRKGYEK
jgi:hypothetical protein